MQIDFLFFVEDPGAANFVAPLIPFLEEEKYNVKVIADGIAQDYLRKFGIEFDYNDKKEDAKIIFNKYNPRLLIVGTAENPNTLGLRLIEVARYKGIKSIAVIDARMNSEFRFSGGTNHALRYVPDYLLVPDEWTKESFNKIGFPKEKIFVCGNPHFDYVFDVAVRLHREGFYSTRSRIFPDLHPNKKVLTFISEGSQRTIPVSYNQILNENYMFNGRGSSTGRTEIAVEEFLDAVESFRPQCYLVLRLHPKDVPSDFLAYKEEFDYFSQKEDPLETVYASDIVVGMTSMLLCEASLLGKTIISLVPTIKEKDYFPVMKGYDVTFVHDSYELMNELKHEVSKEFLFSKQMPKRDHESISKSIINYFNRCFQE